jgi:hypothetical protein
MIMTLRLPKPVSAYFAADAVNGEAVSGCFAENAVVEDEGHTYNGRAEIKRWKEEASTKYQYTCEPLVHEDKGNKCVVTCRLTGNFPGSPVDLRFAFELAGEQIVSLRVAP